MNLHKPGNHEPGLHEPLGTAVRKRGADRRLVAWAAAALAGTVALAGIGLVLAGADPHGGEPSAVATLPPPSSSVPPSSVPPARVADARAPDPTPTGSLAPAASARVAGTGASPSPTEPRYDVATVEGGVKVFRGASPPAGAPAPDARSGPLIIDVTQALDDPLNKARTTKLSALSLTKPRAPLIDSLGAPAETTHAGQRPRVAIFVGGMGLGRDATRTAIDTMPPAVTLAFVPYGDKVDGLADAAKAKGHEVLLQVPMQNAGGAALGPHMLKPGASAETTAADLAWLMDRIKGYDGVVNLLGAPVTADADAMGALVKAAAARNLFVLDDGTSPRSRVVPVAEAAAVPAARADVVLDATGDPAVVRANLDRLVAIARRKGSAIGMASGLPDHLGAIARFAAGLGDQGIDLVPVSQLARRDVTAAR